ncbi:hypothetical protein V1511DRAFT_497808 [Dipodascopsis uninucleata]
MGKYKKASKNSQFRSSLARISRSAGQDHRPRDIKEPESAISLISKLSSVEESERVEAISAITNLIELPIVRKSLLKEKLVHIILERLLSDNSNDVVRDSYSILRNLAIEEGYDLCVFIWRKDVLTAIDGTLRTSRDFLNGNNVLKPTTQRKYYFDLIENILSLLTSLGSSSEDVMNSIEKRFPDLPTLLVSILSSSDATEEVKFVASESMYILSQIQPSYLVDMKSLEFRIDTSLSMPTQMYCLGIKYNIYEMSQKVEIDLLDIISEVFSIMDRLDIEAAHNVLTNKGIIQNDKQKFTMDIALAARTIAGAQTGMELVSAITESIGNREKIDVRQMNKELSNGLEDHAFNEDEMIVESDTDFSPVIEEIAKVFLVRGFKLFEKYIALPETISRALQAMNNTCWFLNSLKASSIEWVEFTYTLWNKLWNFSLASNDTESNLAIIGTLTAISKLHRGDVPVELSRVRILISSVNDKGNTMEDMEYKIRVIELLGSLAICKGRMDITKDISVFLLTQVISVHSNNAEAILESLDALYDIFADETYEYDEEIFVKGGFLNHLVQVQPKVRLITKQIDKRKNPLLRNRADEVCLNLQRFIAYKKNKQAMK